MVPEGFVERQLGTGDVGAAKGIADDGPDVDGVAWIEVGRHRRAGVGGAVLPRHVSTLMTLTHGSRTRELRVVMS